MLGRQVSGARASRPAVQTRARRGVSLRRVSRPGRGGGRHDSGPPDALACHASPKGGTTPAQEAAQEAAAPPARGGRGELRLRRGHLRSGSSGSSRRGGRGVGGGWQVLGGCFDERPEVLCDLSIEVKRALGEVDELGSLPRQIVIPGGMEGWRVKGGETGDVGGGWAGSRVAELVAGGDRECPWPPRGVSLAIRRALRRRRSRARHCQGRHFDLAVAREQSRRVLP